MKPHRGVLILVLGILAWVICFPCGIAAWIMGNSDLKEMDTGTMDPSGRGMTLAGKICGMILTILMILAFVGGFLAALIVGALHHRAAQ